MLKKTIFFTALVLLGGCSTSPLQVAETQNSAKIRVFHGSAVYMHPGKTCYGVENKEKIHAAAGGFSLLVANKKVGMPVTDDIHWSYHEYVIPAEKPLTLEMYWRVEGGGSAQSCGPIGATFTPEVGKYYDTSIIVTTASCSVQLRELTEISPGKASATIKATTPAPRCPKN